MNAITALLLSVLCGVAGQLFLKKGMNRVGRVGSRGIALRWKDGASSLLLGGGAYLGSMLLWLFALSRVSLSFAFPFISLGYVGIVLVARLVLRERLDAYRIVGSLLIVLGVVTVSLS